MKVYYSQFFADNIVYGEILLYSPILDLWFTDTGFSNEHIESVTPWLDIDDLLTYLGRI